MENSSIVRGRGRSRIMIGQIIKKDLDLNGISLDLIDNKTLWFI